MHNMCLSISDKGDNHVRYRILPVSNRGLYLQYIFLFFCEITEKIYI